MSRRTNQCLELVCVIAVANGPTQSGCQEPWAGKALSGPCVAHSLCRGVHSKQLVFRIRELLEYGHHTRDRWEGEGRERAISSTVGQGTQASGQSR